MAPITDADGKDPRAAAIAFTWTGLAEAGTSGATRSRPSRRRSSEGMYQEDRLRRLGDKVDDEWQGTVIDGGPKWSGNIAGPQAAARRCCRAADREAAAPASARSVQVTTPSTVHALLLLYEKDENAVQTWARQVEDALAPHDVRVVHRLPLDLRLDENGIGREHFGFADGLSQPIPYGERSAIALSDWSAQRRHRPRDRWHGVPLGEILIGHTNAHHENAPGPVVADDRRTARARRV